MTTNFRDPDFAQAWIDRLARAHWITGTNVDAPAFFELEYSRRGQMQLTQIAEAMARFAPELLTTPEPNISQNNAAALMSACRIAARDLEPPDLTDEDLFALLVLASALSKR